MGACYSSAAWMRLSGVLRTPGFLIWPSAGGCMSLACTGHCVVLMQVKSNPICPDIDIETIGCLAAWVIFCLPKPYHGAMGSVAEAGAPGRS